MSEIRSDHDEMIERLRVLGATGDEIAAFEEQWPEMLDGERLMLKRMNDGDLRNEIVMTRAENDFHSQTPEERDAAAAEVEQAAARNKADDEYRQILAETVDGVVSYVDSFDDPDERQAVARRLRELEADTPDARVTLLRELDHIAKG